MAAYCVRKRWIGPGAIWLILLQPPCLAAASEQPWLALRNNNPFLLIFGLPAYEPVKNTDAGKWNWRLSLDAANHADAGSRPDESVVLDGEGYQLTMSLRYGLSKDLTVGADVPFISHTGGFLDAPIENWHDFWGLSNTKRSGPRDQLRLRYDNAIGPPFELTSSTRGIGDIRLFANVPIGDRNRPSGRQLGLRAGIKVPTGEPARLQGSGAFDFWFETHASHSTTVRGRAFSLSAVAGLLIPGDIDVLPITQRDLVGFGGLSAAWKTTERFSAVAQLYAQSSYYDSALDELGGNSVQLALGGAYDLSGTGMSLSFGLVEDLFDNATTDFALHLSLRGSTRRQSKSSR